MLHKKILNDLNGWLVIDKPLEMGSTDVVRILKSTLHPIKIGHAGTLDPLATGVLPIALGQATRTIDYVMNGRKKYVFWVRFGQATSTDDLGGKVIETSDKIPTYPQIQSVLPQFIGHIEQVPPAYSALKINGKRAYDLARAGVEFEIKKRSVDIFALTLTEQINADTFAFEVECGKGTYVRSLGRDIAKALGTCGVICKLRRTQNACFEIKNTITLEKIKEICYSDFRTLALIPVLTVLGDIPDLAVEERQALAFSCGQPLSVNLFKGNDSIQNKMLMKVVFNKELIAFVLSDGQMIRPVKVFKQFIKDKKDVD